MTSWLHEQRLEAVHEVIRNRAARTVLDLGCGDGDLLIRFAFDPQVERIVGVDLCERSLDRLRARLKSHKEKASGQIDLVVGSLLEDSPKFSGFDCAVLVETIEHIDPDRLGLFEQAVLGRMKPTTVVLTTPNAEFNPLLGVPANWFRHPDHRFEWDRSRFRRWVRGAASRHGYQVECSDIAGRHPTIGGTSQMAVFDLSGAESRPRAA